MMILDLSWSPARGGGAEPVAIQNIQKDFKAEAPYKQIVPFPKCISLLYGNGSRWKEKATQEHMFVGGYATTSVDSSAREMR